jgi:hypothetical protein
MHTMGSEQNAKESVQIDDQKIIQFWRNFQNWAIEHRNDNVHDQVESSNLLVEKYFSGISLEMLSADNDERVDLVITAHGSLERFPLVMRISELAPTLDRYVLKLFRERVVDKSFGINMDGFSLATDDIHVETGLDDGLIGLKLSFAKEIPFDMLDHAKNMAFIMMDHVLGEYGFSIKVGYVDFVDRAEIDQKKAVPLSQLPVVFDEVWLKKLGRSGYFPPDDGAWTMMTIDFPEDEDGPASKGIVTFHDGANALVGRADLTHLIGVDLPAFDNEKIEQARDFHSNFADLLAKDQSGIVAYMMVRQGWRVAIYYVTNPVAAKSLMIAELNRAGLLERDVFEQFDPSWSKYRRYCSHMFENVN